METLSDKEEECFCFKACGRKKYRKEDVKEFIRKLKEELIMLYDTEKHINELVDKLAGDKLI